MSMLVNPFVFGGGAVDDPGDVTGLHLWLRGDQTGVADGAEITTWSDLSGQNNFCSGAGATKPVLRATGGPDSQPCVEFEGTVSYFTVPNFHTGFTAAHAFAIVKIDVEPPSVASKCGPPFGHFGNEVSELASAYPFTDSNVYENFGTTVRKSTGNPTPALTNWHLYEIRTASGAWSNWFNGTSHFSTGTNTVGFRNNAFIGRDETGGTINFLDGRIAEGLIYNKVLSAGEILTVKGYFTSRYPSITIA